MFSSYQAIPSNHGNLDLGSAHEIINDLHRRADRLAPRFAQETAEAGCTNLRPGDQEPRKQQAWDLLAEALSWNLIADYPRLVAAAQDAIRRDRDVVVANDFSFPGQCIKVATAEAVVEYADRVNIVCRAYQAAGIEWVTSGGKVWPAGSEYDAACQGCIDQVAHSHQAPEIAEEDLYEAHKQWEWEQANGGPQQSFEDWLAALDADDEEEEAPSLPQPTQEPLPGKVSIRTAAKAYDAQGRHTGPGEWLNLIHQANRICKDHGLEPLFDQPTSSGDWWAGGYVEEYPEARVLHRTDESVSVVSKSPLGAQVLALAAEALSIHWSRL